MSAIIYESQRELGYCRTIGHRRGKSAPAVVKHVGQRSVVQIILGGVGSLVLCLGLAHATNAPNDAARGEKSRTVSNSAKNKDAPALAAQDKKVIDPAPAAAGQSAAPAAGGTGEANSGQPNKARPILTNVGLLVARNAAAGGAEHIDHSNPVDWDSEVAVKLDNVSDWASVTTGSGRLLLYLDDRALDDKEIGPIRANPEQHLVIYRLVRNRNTRDAWKALLSHPCDPNCGPRSYHVTVGPKGQAYDDQPEKDGTTELRINTFRIGWPIGLLGAALLAAVVLLVFSATVRTYFAALLRENETSAAKGPYSLARCQMLFWFCLVVWSYLLIYCLTSDYDTLTASVLTLIGISGGTSLMGVVVDSGSRDDARKKLGDVATQIDSLRAAPAPGPQVPGQIAALAQQQADLESIVNPRTSGHFLRDILSYGGAGTEVHRLQILVWTLVLGVIFVSEVYSTLGMPDFSATLLGLMGISSGTYIGFKIATQS